MHILPAGRKRQAHEDTFYAGSGGVKSKRGTPIVDEIKLYISSAANLLPLLHFGGEGHVLSAIDNGDVGGQEGSEAILDEGEELLLVFLCFVEVVEEDAADAAGFAAVLVVEVFVTPFFEARVVGFVVLVAGVFDGVVEENGVFIVEVRGCEVAAAAVPPCGCVAVVVGGFEVAVVEVHGGRVGVVRVQHHGETGGKEGERVDVWVECFVVYAHLLNGSAGEAAIDDRGVHAAFFKDVAVLQDAGYAAAAFRALPCVDFEFCAINLFKLSDNLLLLLFYELLHPEAHGGLFGYAIFALEESVFLGDGWSFSLDCVICPLWNGLVGVILNECVLNYGLTIV